MSHQLVDHWQSKATVTQLCELLDISRVGYYAAKSRNKPAQICATSLHLQAAFNANGKCYGNRRLVAALRAESICIGRYKARRIIGWAWHRPCQQNWCVVPYTWRYLHVNLSQVSSCIQTEAANMPAVSIKRYYNNMV